MMNDGMLSQDEIDALLNNVDNDEEEHVSEPPSIEDYLSSLEQDALGEIGNISFGSSATTLSTLLNQKVDITTPTISVIDKEALENEFPHPHVGVEVKYTEGFSGVNLFVLKQNDASIIADLMLGGEGQASENELTEIHLSAVQEAMNQMMGTAATSMSTVFSKRVDISPPAITLLDVKKDEGNKYIPDDNILIKVSFQLKIGNLIDSNIMQLLPVSFAKSLVDELLNPSDQGGSSTTEEDHEDMTMKQETPQASSQSSMGQQQSAYSSDPTPKQVGGQPQQPNAHVQTAEFSSFEELNLPATEKRNLDMLLDIPLKVTVELGRTQRTVKDILELSSGSIVELDKLAGEPVDIHVNNKLIAKGEVVVIDENFGVRVTDIVSQSDRLKKLR
ncbi:flagellar motor switch phosphatase FliY [Aquibacillus koreensis]|uniref:Flagellar motor switch phosphatase FliY n=1 Tax=Aquibacillus koreensis TaxID=279446 RepID=A0A9X3WR39_9BACI|nr:flagellar motor switch phosphatase FliY [Aquibacillus koreensis]MCT2534532.1 flagellar motor switch phosphatase FliY [Aquibacillus koreensis]MDC3421874.1 flagellar motor switch phosphatase FliY [Aquibacillus koreensis]